VSAASPGGLAAIVLAGGAASRMGGRAKPLRRVGGRPMIERVLDAVAGARPRIVVGSWAAPVGSWAAPVTAAAGVAPGGGLPGDVLHTSESPAGTGPAAAVAAGLTLVPEDIDLVAVLAADLPFLTGPAVGELTDAVHIANDEGHRAADGDPVRHAGAVYVGVDGRPQWLCGVWRCSALRGRLAVFGDPAGRSLRDLLSPLTPALVTATGFPPPWFDADTEADLRQARQLQAGETA